MENVKSNVLTLLEKLTFEQKMAEHQAENAVTEPVRCYATGRATALKEINAELRLIWALCAETA